MNERICIPIGLTKEGESILAMIEFDRPLAKGMLKRLAAQLQALQAGADVLFPGDKKTKENTPAD